MTTEQKAKAYDEALKWMRDLYPNMGIAAKEKAESIFPELCESKDERIRKTLINFFQDWHKNRSHCWGISVPEILAWLENQGEHKKFRDSIQVGDEVTRNRDGVIVNLSQLNRVAKQGEQKLPIEKFHEGEWVVFNDKHESVYQIEKIENFQYTLRHILGGSMPLSFSGEDMIRPWAIQDAKDGDVLACNEEILLFKSYSVQGRISLYCWYNGQTNNFHSKEVVDTLMTTRNKIYPATKEQRDILFSKMKEAGYTFDFEKKELKKVEKKSQRMISAEAKEAMYDKPTDEDMKEALRTEYEKGRADAFAQMQKEWSEEDKDFMYDTLSNLTELKDRYGEGYGNVGKCIDFLKSLKYRYTWKPSDEQMKAFEQVYDWYNNNFAPSETLTSLYKDLEKLKGE